jgi:hypothetical protein
MKQSASRPRACAVAAPSASTDAMASSVAVDSECPRRVPVGHWSHAPQRVSRVLFLPAPWGSNGCQPRRGRRRFACGSDPASLDDRAPWPWSFCAQAEFQQNYQTVIEAQVMQSDHANQNNALTLPSTHPTPRQSPPPPCPQNWQPRARPPPPWQPARPTRAPHARSG